MKLSQPKKMLVLLSVLLFFYGFYLGGIQLVIADVSAFFNMQITGIGILVAVPHLSSLILPPLLGSLADKIGKKWILVIFASVFCVGNLLAGSSGQIGVYILGALMIGAGTSVCESVSSAVLSDCNPEESARYINISQCMLSAGAVLSPVLLQWWIPRVQIGWRLMFFLCAGAYAVMILLLMFTAFPKSRPAVQENGNKSAGFPLFRSVVFVSAFVGMALYVGLETGMGYFVESFFEESLNRPALGAYAISLYWIGMTLSRLVSGAWIQNFRKVLLLHFAACIALFVILFLAQPPWLSVALCAVIGFAFGPIWSTLVAMAAQEFPEHSAKATGMMSSAGAIGSMVVPVIMGLLSDGFGIRSGFLLLAVMSAGGWLLSRNARK